LASDYYPPFIGGAQIQTQLLARAFRSRGHAVAVATAWQNNVPSFEDDDGISINRLRQVRTIPGLTRARFQHHQPPFPDPVTAISLRRLIARFNPDVVHSYGWMSYSVSAALLGTRIPMLITARDYGYSCANRTLMRDGEECDGPGLLKCVGCAGRNYGRPKGWIAALGVRASSPLLRRKVSGVHSVSSYVREIVRRDFLDEDSMSSGHVIHDVIGSVPDSHADGVALADEPDGLPSEPFILFVGAFRRIKGVFELLAAYQLLDPAPPLVMIGTLEPDSPTEFPPGVHLLLDLPHEAVLAAASSSRCLFGVMPSRFPEPFGTVVCEVMSSGKPVIGTIPGGHSDMIEDGETGLLVPRGDVQALAEAMQSLIDDPAKRERFGKASRERARQFTAEVSIPRLERLYEQLVTHH
jgi:glycosyltransferase involved in cell wall biosynthesis